MKRFIIILLFVTFVCNIKAQPVLPDSLQIAYQSAPDDSVKFKISRVIYTFYEETNRDSALHYAQVRYAVAKKYHRRIEEAYLQGQMGYQQIYLGRFSEALTNLTKAIQIATESKEENAWELTPFNTPGKSREITLSMLNHMYGHLKLQTGSSESVHYFKEGRRIGLEIGNDFRVTVGDMVLATNYLMLNQPDSALVFAMEGEKYAIRGGISKYLAYIWSVMGNIYQHKGADSLALSYYQKSLQLAKTEGNFTVVSGTYVNLCNYYQSKKNADSLLYYAASNLSVMKSLGAVTSSVAGDINLGYAFQSLAEGFALKGNTDSTNKYLQLALTVKDSLTAIKLKRLAAFQRLTLDEQLRQQNEEKKRVESETRRRMYVLLAGIVVACIIILLIYRNNRQKQKAYNLLQKQKSETDLQKKKADTALQELKSTQAQLIQSEKMASLGELTAGIAHEIQNPLNFVNNFSEVSAELIDEATGSRQRAAENSPEVGELLSDIKQNLVKINHHGKRADAIVKGMLQHSQSGRGQKEPMDINALAEEYLRLSYHSFQNKNPDVKIEIKSDFDPTINKVNVVPQDIGKVLFNVLNNAFYACAEHSRIAEAERSRNVESALNRNTDAESGRATSNTTENENQNESADSQPRLRRSPLSVEHTNRNTNDELPRSFLPGPYHPQVSISTKTNENKIDITVTDNGTGIPQKIIDKIFQPFFTTKPTSQGTGLGLSLTYDIIKAHGGEIRVSSLENQGSEFIITLITNA